MTAPRWRAWLLEGKRLYWRFGCWYVPRSDEILHHRSKTADSRPIANAQGGKRLLLFLPCDGPEMAPLRSLCRRLVFPLVGGDRKLGAPAQ